MTLLETCPVCGVELTRLDQHRCPNGHDLAGDESENAGRDTR